MTGFIGCHDASWIQELVESYLEQIVDTDNFFVIDVINSTIMIRLARHCRPQRGRHPGCTQGQGACRCLTCADRHEYKLSPRARPERVVPIERGYTFTWRLFNDRIHLQGRGFTFA